jgi:hypothetical protein
VQATATLNTALKEWRKAELEVRILKAQISNISNLCNCKLVAGESAITEEGRTCGQQSCNKKPPEGGASMTSSARHQSLSVDVESSATAEEQEQCSTDSQVSGDLETSLYVQQNAFFVSQFAFQDFTNFASYDPLSDQRDHGSLGTRFAQLPHAQHYFCNCKPNIIIQWGGKFCSSQAMIYHGVQSGRCKGWRQPPHKCSLHRRENHPSSSTREKMQSQCGYRYPHSNRNLTY